MNFGGGGHDHVDRTIYWGTRVEADQDGYQRRW